MSLPAVNSARLPVSYERARQALAECSRIDECKDWSDRAAAMASYAKQAQDDQLEKQSMRIRARAVRRCGELLKQIEPGKTGPKPELSGGAPTNLTRKDAAAEAGMSRDQMHTALRVANVPEHEFEAEVEAESPPTLTALAQQGIKPKPRVDTDHLQGRTPEDFNLAMHFRGMIEDYARDLAKYEVARATTAQTPEEFRRVQSAIRKIDELHDRIMTGR